MNWQQQNPDLVGKEEGIYYERCIQYALLCREEGHVHSWEGSITPLNLELEFEFLTEQCFGRRDKISGTIIEFSQSSDAQRRLLMYLFERVHKVWLQHNRRNFATDAAVSKYLSGTSGTVGT